MEALNTTDKVHTKQLVITDKTNIDQCRKKKLSKGCTHLMYACQQGLTDEICMEIRCKSKMISQRDNNNKNALHYCSGQKDLVAAASVALAAPELVESADEDGFTPLHLAVIQGNMSLVNLLLAGKADVNALDNEGHSVVHWATVCGEIEALRAVLLAGADISSGDINGGSPLHYAAQMCGGNSGNRKSGPISSSVSIEILNIILLHPKSDVHVVDKDKRQPLLWAASAGSSKALVALINAGAKVESADKDGLTAIHCAASRGHTECIDTLISLCGAPTDLIDTNGCTALHYAVTLGHADAVALLLDLDADPNRQDRKGRTPAHCGCAKGQFETVKLLKERGDANMWLRNAKGDLPIHEAALSGRRELVLWLLEQRPKQVNVTSNDGRTMLHIAASNDNTEMCKMLLDQGADVNSIYRSPRNVVMTPLDCALQKGFRSTAKFLQLHSGLPASKLRLSGRSPNAINDQELVKPLHSINKSKSDIKINSDDFVNSCTIREHQHAPRKCVCKLTDSCRRRCSKLKCCIHLRASSCETLAKGNESSDINRSKSNIELQRSRKSHPSNRTSRLERSESTITYSSSSSSDFDCVNCKMKELDRSKKCRRSRAKSTPRKKNIYNDRSSTDEEWNRKSVTKTKYKKSFTKTTKIIAHNKPDNLGVPVDMCSANEIKVDDNANPSAHAGDDKSIELNIQPLISVDVSTQDSCQPEDPKNSNIIIATADVHASNISESLSADVNSDNIDINKELVEQEANSDTNLNAMSIEIEECNNKKSVSNAFEEINTQPNNAMEHAQSQETVNIISEINGNEDNLVVNDNDKLSKTDNNDNDSQCNNELQIPDELCIPQNETNENQTTASISDELDNPQQVHIINSPDSHESDELAMVRTTTNAQAQPVVTEDLTLDQNDNVNRKSSFTVLDTIDLLDQHKLYIDSDFEINNRPSFSVLESNEHNFNIDDAKTSDDDNQLIASADEGDLKSGRRKRVKSRAKFTNIRQGLEQISRDQDSGFEPSPRAMRTKIPSPQLISDLVNSRRSFIGGRSNGLDMTAVTQNLNMNIRRYYMERNIFQHLLELKSLQIRSSKLNESVLVKRAVDNYHKSMFSLSVTKANDSEMNLGSTVVNNRLGRYTYKDYTFKNFEIFLYEALKSLQKSGTSNFQNISEVYKEAEHHLNTNFSRVDKALQCTTKTHRCLHAAHAYTGIPCAAYIPLMNHHTMPKHGFGPLKGTGLGSFYLPKIRRPSTKSTLDKTGTTGGINNRVSLELSHGENKQLIALPANKLDSNKRYYVTFTVKGNESHQISNNREKSPHSK